MVIYQAVSSLMKPARPLICEVDEVYLLLQFATSAKSIKNKPVVNEVISGETMLKRYKKEINDLKKQLEEVQDINTGCSCLTLSLYDNRALFAIYNMLSRMCSRIESSSAYIQ